jgi:vacuolar protein-sorting-associated protein 4
VISAQLLIQFDGVSNSADGVLVLGATNTPWALDQAVRRRFEKRIYIPLPDERARATMLRINLGKTPNNLQDEHFQLISQRTEGYSGALDANFHAWIHWCLRLVASGCFRASIFLIAILISSPMPSARSYLVPGHDMSIVVKEALMEPIRCLQEATHFHRVAGPDAATDPESYFVEACAPSDPTGMCIAVFSRHEIQ